MIYTTRDGAVYDITQFSLKDQELLEWMKKEAQESTSGISFNQRMSQGIISHAQSSYKEHWQNHPIYLIQKDLLARVGIREEELSDKLD